PTIRSPRARRTHHGRGGGMSWSIGSVLVRMRGPLAGGERSSYCPRTMGQSRGRRARTRHLAAGGALLVVAVASLLVARGGDQGPSDVAGVALLGVLAVVALVAVAGLGAQLAGVDGEAPEIAGRLA